MIQATNWRLAWVTLGLIVLLVAVPPVYLVVHDDPEKLGLRPDGDAQPPKGDVSPDSNHLAGPLQTSRWRESFRSWPIWQITAGFCALWH